MNENRLSVLGTAVGELAPDRAEWTFTVRDVDPDSSAAFERCSKRLRKLAGTLADAEVTTGQVAVEDEWHSHGHKKTGRHVASGVLKAAVGLEAAGAMAATAMQAGADYLTGPKPLYPDDTATRDRLFGEAVTNARVTAEAMATAAGRALGRVVSIRDPRADESDGTVYARAASGGGGDEGPPVLTRPQRLSVAVAVVFEMT